MTISRMDANNSSMHVDELCLSKTRGLQKLKTPSVTCNQGKVEVCGGCTTSSAQQSAAQPRRPSNSSSNRDKCLSARGVMTNNEMCYSLRRSERNASRNTRSLPSLPVLVLVVICVFLQHLGREVAGSDVIRIGEYDNLR